MLAPQYPSPGRYSMHGQPHHPMGHDPQTDHPHPHPREQHPTPMLHDVPFTTLFGHLPAPLSADSVSLTYASLPPPGMTKTLHLYEPHFLSLLEEAMAHPQRLMATAVLEPHMGEGHDPGPGGCTGGYNFSLSCGCLVQVGVRGGGEGDRGRVSKREVKAMRGREGGRGGQRDRGVTPYAVVTLTEVGREGAAKGAGRGPEVGGERSVTVW